MVLLDLNRGDRRHGMLQFSADHAQQIFGRLRGDERLGGQLGIAAPFDVGKQVLDFSEGARDLKGFGYACRHQREDQDAGRTGQSSSHEIHAFIPPVV